MASWRTPEEVRIRLRTRYAGNAGAWALGGGEWPLRIALGAPTQAQARAKWDVFEGWLRRWQGATNVEYVQRHWSGLGVQRLPEHACFDSAEQVARWLDDEDGFGRAARRCAALRARWPGLDAALRRQFEVLSQTDDAQFERLISAFDWLQAHPGSNLYPRQLPIAGIDSKWLEGSPRQILCDWLRALRGESAGSADLIALAGLRAVPERAHLRLLDARLRAELGGLGDILAPVDDLARLNLPGLRRAYAVENLQTGLAFGELPGSVVLIGRGYAVDVLQRLPWLHGIPLHYWGDIDTHGFAILDRLRRHVPHVRSLLMDEATLARHRAVWGEEPKPHAAERLPALDAAEADLYADLRRDRWAARLRLEQERIDWDYAWSAIRASACDGIRFSPGVHASF